MADNRSAAIEFMQKHEQVTTDLANTQELLALKERENDAHLAQISFMNDRINQLEIEKARYVQYSFELSSQLQFIVAGGARGLRIAQHVMLEMSMDSGAQRTPIDGADAKELEDLIARLPTPKPQTPPPSTIATEPPADYSKPERVEQLPISERLRLGMIGAPSSP